MNKKLQQHLREIQKRGAMFRTATVGAVDVEGRTVELSFSSETEKVERWYGIEILGHDAHEIDLSRMNNGAPVCWMHNTMDQRGVVVSGTARVDADRIARCTARYSRSPEGDKLFQDIVDGITTKVSVGYTVSGMRLVEERDGIDVYRITAWQPYEVSNVSVAADDDVGVGRSLENPPEEASPKQVENPTIIKDEPTAATRKITKDTNSMKYRTFTDAQGNQCRVAINDAGEDVGSVEIVTSSADTQRAAAQRGADAERTRTASLMAMGDQFVSSIGNARELAAKAITEGKTAEDLQRTLLDEFNKRAAKPLSEQGGASEVGMTDSEVRRYSFMNVIRALANPSDQAAQRAAAFEIECGFAAQKTLGRSAKGILVPTDVLARAMNTAQSSAGAQMVDNNVLKGSFIDLLRNRTTIMQLATVLSGLVGNVDIPKATGDGTAYWLGEGQDASETGFSLGQLSMSPKTLGAFTEVTRRLLQQTDMSVESMIRTDLIRAIGNAIDKAGYYGLGGEYQPRGLKNQSGINAVDFATAENPTFAEYVKMETEIAADNADIGSMAYVMHTKVRGNAKTTPKFGTGTESTIWEPGNTINGYRTEVTNQILSTDVFFGNFADFVIGLWGGLDLTVDPYSLSKSGGLRIVAFQDVDMLLKRPESICWGSNLVS